MPRSKTFEFDRTLVPVIFSLAGPTMLEQVMQTAVQYIDTAMVGSLGTAATAAVGSTTTVNWLLNSTLSALGAGLLASISQACGRNEPQKARRASALAVLFVLLAGSVFTAVPLLLSGEIPRWMQVEEAIRPLASAYFFILYTPMLFRAAIILFGTVLRAAGDTRSPMRVSIIVNAVNIVLNFFLIYPARTLSLLGLSLPLPGAGLGVVGAAWASAASYTAGGILMTLALWKHPAVSPRGQKLLPERELLLTCLKISLPNMLQRFCASLGYVVFAAMINSLGGLSTAAHTIANTVESAFYIPGYGMMTAAGTLAGNCIGAGDSRRLRRMSSTLLALEFAMMAVSGALLFLLAPQLAGIFTREAEVILLCALVLRMVAVSEPFYGISIILEGMLMGAGKTMGPMIFNSASMWCVRIFGTWLCLSFFGGTLASAWGCMIAGNMALMLMYVLYFRKQKFLS